MVAYTASLAAEYSEAVGLIYHYYYVCVFLLEIYNFREFCKVSFHREHTVNYNELHGIVRKLAEGAVKVCHVIVLVVQSLGEGQPAAVNY